MSARFFEEKLYLNVTDLCQIMKKHGSDKSLGKHNFTTFYSFIFDGLKDQPLKVFELGLGTNNIYMPSSMGPNGKPGASVRGWSEYFSHPETQIFGADIDRDILFNERNIKTYYCDQTNPAVIQKMWDETNVDLFDIIVEDGLHTYEANKTFLANSFHKLKKGGVYIVEDLIPRSVELFRRELIEYKNLLNLSHIEIINIPNEINSYDNSILYIVK